MKIEKILHNKNGQAYYLLGDNMLKKIINVIKKIIMAVLLIYAYNKLALPLNVIIPMNIITVFLVALCGIPSILMLVLFSLICI